MSRHRCYSDSCGWAIHRPSCADTLCFLDRYGLQGLERLLRDLKPEAVNIVRLGVPPFFPLEQTSLHVSHPHGVCLVYTTDVLPSINISVGLVGAYGAQEGVLIQLLVPHHNTWCLKPVKSHLLISVTLCEPVTCFSVSFTFTWGCTFCLNCTTSVVSARVGLGGFLLCT